MAQASFKNKQKDPHKNNYSSMVGDQSNKYFAGSGWKEDAFDENQLLQSDDTNLFDI